MKKPNLVLIHSFPTNSILLKGFIDFLKDYFNVYWIDLPGFIKNIPPLKDISLDNYAKYVQEKIDDLNLEHYWLGGISLGFLVAENVSTDEKCKGMFAVAPCLNSTDLKIPWHIKMMGNIFINIICLMNVHQRIWESISFKHFLSKIGNPPKRIETMLNTINSRTFFETAKLVFKNKNEFQLQQKPSILMINKNDKTLRAGKIMAKFKKDLDKLLIINHTIEHYPKEITKDHFKKNVKEEHMKQIVNFMHKHN